MKSGHFDLLTTGAIRIRKMVHLRTVRNLASSGITVPDV